MDSNSNTDAAPPAGGGNLPSKGRTRADRAREDLLRRVLPHNLDAEQAILNGVFLRPEVLNELVDILSEDDFYHPGHRILFGVFVELLRKNVPVDEVTVFDALHNRNQLEAIGGAVYLADLSKAVVSGANAVHWARIVRDKATQRQLIAAAAEIIANAYEPQSDVPELLDESERRIFSISERTNSKTFFSSKDLIDKVIDDLTTRYSNRDSVTGLTTGYQNLNQLTAGLQPSDLIILAARPSMGKTAFALNMAMRAALTTSAVVAIFSLEMSKESLIERMLCAKGRVDLLKTRRGQINDQEWKQLSQAADELTRGKIFIDDTSGLSPLSIRARCRRLQAEHGLDLVVVDYLQLMHSSRHESREQEISDISRNLKALAKELSIPVIALSQLNRKVEERTDKRPLLSDLRESGAIEQDADLIMFIHREDAYRKKEEARDGQAEIIIGKHRNGPTGTVKLAYYSQYTVFDDLQGDAVPSEFSAVSAESLARKKPVG